jgi:hypothetical protein
MSRRQSILTALVNKIKLLDGSAGYHVNLYGQAFDKLKFWDSVNNFPSVYSSTGTETREYMPAGFTWGFLGISLKVYCKGDYAQTELENLLEDIEKVISYNNVLVYDTTNNYTTTEILVASITTDEGLLAPYAVGEINLQVRYQLM